jgi:hypothetical protein
MQKYTVNRISENCRASHMREKNFHEINAVWFYITAKK